MKSVFFGYSAKVALALLAVGTMTSCYEKEEVDKTPVVTPPAAKYYIQGNVSAAKTGAALRANVAVNGAAQSVNADGYYITGDLTKPGEYKVTAAMEDYLDAVKTVTLPETPDGGVCIASADFALNGADAAAQKPTMNVPATKEQAEQAMDEAKDDIVAAFTTLGVDANDVEIEIVSGGAKVSVPVAVESAVGEAVTVTVPYFEGFASTVTPEQDNLFTKAVTDGQIWLASAEAALNMTYGMKNIGMGVTFEGVAGKSINGFKAVIMYAIKTLEFSGYPGQVIYQESIRVEPSYESHDSHDSHDSHNGHGSNPAAGGGSGK